MSPLDGGSCIPDSVFWDCRGFYFFIRGVWFGAILVLVLEFVVVRRLLLGPSGLGAKSAVVRSRSEEAAPPGTAPPAAEQFPENVVAWLKKATLPSGNVEAAARGMVDASPTETCFFMNVYVHRYFLELRRSELLKARWKLKVLEKLAHRMESLSMISSLTFTDFDFGVNPPMFHGARVLKYHSDRAEITLELDTTYKGGLTVGIEVTLATGGITIPVVVKLTGLAGRLRLRVPSRVDPLQMDLTFAEDPNATFEVVSGLYLKDSEYLKETLTKYLNSKVSKLFSDFWTYPAWRNLELPMINRKVTDPIDIPKFVGVVREMVDGKPSAHVWTSGKLTNLAVNAAGTALPGQPSQKSPAQPTKRAVASSGSIPDVLADAVFPVDVVVKSDNVEHLQTRLSSLFLQLAKEDTKVAGKGLEAWKTVKAKDGIVQQRKKILLPGTVAGSALTASEFNRTTFRVAVDPERVFQILSKPEHQRLISDSFSGAIEIKRFDENATVWFYKYRFGKTPAADRLIRVFEMKRKRVDLSGDPEAAITSDEAPQGYADALDTMIQTSIPEELEPPSSSSSGTETYADGAADTGAVLQDRVVLADEPEDWAEQSPEDSELAETLRRLAQQREPTNTGGDDPAPPPLPPRNKAGSASSRPASISSSSVVSTASAASPAPAPTLFISDTTAPARPQNLNSSSSSTSIKSTGAPPAAPNAPASSRLPALMGRTSSPAGGEKEKAAVKGDAGHPLEDTLRVHLYGYLVESIPDDLQACVVTMLTQYSSKSIQRLESSWDVCRQLKISIEELASLSSLPAEETGEDGSPTPSNRRLSRLRQSHVGEDEGKLSAPEKGQRIEKLKSLASGAGKKAYAWWAGKSSAQSSTIGNAVAAGAVIPSSFGVDAKAPRQTDSSSAHAVMFDDADSDDDGSGEVDYEEEEGGHGLPKEALRRSRVTRLLRRAAEKVRPPDEVETVSIYSQNDDGDGAETRSVVSTEPPGGQLDDPMSSAARLPDSMSNLEEAGSEKAVQSLDIKKIPFQDFLITVKQGARLDVTYNGDFTTATELAWEFKVKAPDAVNFALLFKPSAGKRMSAASLGAMDDRFLRALQDTDLETGAKAVIPLSPVFAMTKAVRGRIAMSGFPAGTFIALWDNAYSRKTDKILSYKVKLQPIRVISSPQIPRPHFSQEMSSAVVVRTRTAFRAQLFYTEEIERLSRHGSSSPSQNPDRGQTFLQWEFSTGGYDIFFKIVFTPVDPDAFHAARAGSSEPSLEHLGVAFPETSTPPSSPLLSEKEPGGVSPVLQPAPSPILGDDNPVMRSQSWGPGVSGSSLVGAAEAPNAPLLTSLSAHGTAPVLPSRHIVVVPSVKCNSQKGTISGSLLITGKTGVYTFVWDNTASLVTSKHIAYRAGTLTFT